MSQRRQVPKGKARPRGWGQQVTPVREIAKRLKTDPPRSRRRGGGGGPRKPR